MTAILIVSGVLVATATIAFVVKGQRPDAPTGANFAIPQQIDRNDFTSDEPWLFILFSSGTCAACADAREVIQVDTLDPIGLEEVHFEQARSLHTRYAIDSVPTVLLTDADGVVCWSSIGAPSLAAFREVLKGIGITPPDNETRVAIT